MKLLGRRNNEADDADGTPEADLTPEPTSSTARTTAPKGRPTPTRNDKRRGPVAPAPMTAAEARQRRKDARKTMTKEERQADKIRRRAAMATRREKMMAGEEAYLLPRDQGPVRRYARDIVDSRRNVLGLFMPSALFIMFVVMMVPRLQIYTSPLMLLMMLVMGIDGILLARRVNKAVDAKFPDNGETHFKLGLYAVGRATHLRRMRAPRPQVTPGTKVA
ncbi:MAG: DUF3043 domain-containing protein [Mycobacterium sp.]